MKRLLFSVLIVTLSLFINFCNTTEPKSEPELVLKLEDVSCTEAWLQLTTNNIQLPATINLLINNTVSKIYVLSTQDSLLYIDSLLPNQNYKFLVTMQHSSNSSNETIVTTMDTTSHNFTWQTFTFGQHSSSVLYDVAIINENDIWAVGEIYMNDSLGNPDPACYNAIHWNGSSWELKRIQTLFRGNMITVPLEGIYAFSSTDIWMVGSLPIHGDGTNWIMYDLRATVDPNLSLSKLWGSSSNDLYAVGNNGNIAHYQNGSWQKIESGTDIDFRDIWGVNSTETAQQKIFCIASNKYELIDKKVYELKNNNISEISNESLPWSLSSIWFKSKYKCYIVGDGIFIRGLSSSNSWQDITLGITPYYTHAIRGAGLNDIVVGGSFGELLHFNGSSWYSYKGRELPEFVGNYFAIGIKENVVCAVGQATINSNVAIISLGIK